MEKDHAILIRRFKLSETSLIVHWCTARAGIIKTVARAACRPKSRFHGKLDLFFGAEIEYARSQRSDLHNLRDIALTNPRFAIRESYPRVLAASYFVRLLEIVCERETPIGEFYDLLERALTYLEQSDPTRRAILHFESELARGLGLPAEDGAAIGALRDLFARVPAQRAELLGCLEEG
ncbi:MAG: DNA repair protein RecO [Verrucomicrobiales bacterium]